MRLEVFATLSDVPLKNWQRLMEMQKPDEEGNPTPVSEIETISSLLDVSMDTLRRVEASSIEKLSAHIKTLFDRQYNLIRFFHLDGKEFGFIPNLDQATWGEASDIEDYISNPETFHKAMAVMFRPVTLSRGRGGNRKYQIEEYQPGKYDAMMLDAPLDVALGAQVFFCRLTADLVASTQNYMKQELPEMISKGFLAENGEGIINSILWLEEISKKWRLQADRIYTPV
jgi:hypothetical protein